MVQTVVCIPITVFAVSLGKFYQACLMNVMFTLAVAALVG
jgi:ABC-type antimicrobial peptide transport system permease subunit